MAQPTSPRDGSDWTVQASDAIESLVVTVRDKTVVPATTIARGLVYGIIALLLALAAGELLITGLLRVLIVYLPVGGPPGRSVWVSYAILGGIFAIAGLLILRNAKQANQTDGNN